MRKSILIFLLVLSVSVYSNATRTFSDISDHVRLDLRDTGPSSVYRISAARMVRAINYIQDEIVEYTGCIRGRYSTTTVAEQREYDLPTDILGKPTRVAYYNTSDTSTFKRLEFWTIDGLDTNYMTAWEATTEGLPKKYYLRVEKVGLVPAPSSTYVSTTYDNLRMDYIVDPTDATTALTGEPFNGYQHLYAYHNVLIIGVEALLTKNAKLAEQYYILLENMRKKINSNPDAFIGQKNWGR